jgi:hypothetical protein
VSRRPRDPWVAALAAVLAVVFVAAFPGARFVAGRLGDDPPELLGVDVDPQTLLPRGPLRPVNVTNGHATLFILGSESTVRGPAWLVNTNVAYGARATLGLAALAVALLWLVARFARRRLQAPTVAAAFAVALALDVAASAAFDLDDGGWGFVLAGGIRGGGARAIVEPLVAAAIPVAAAALLAVRLRRVA